MQEGKNQAAMPRPSITIAALDHEFAHHVPCCYASKSRHNECTMEEVMISRSSAFGGLCFSMLYSVNCFAGVVINSPITGASVPTNFDVTGTWACLPVNGVQHSGYVTLSAVGGYCDMNPEVAEGGGTFTGPCGCEIGETGIAITAEVYCGPSTADSSTYVFGGSSMIDTLRCPAS